MPEMVRKMAGKHSLLHPTDVHIRATYGWTTTHGFHASRIVRNSATKQIRSHDLADILTTLVEWGFFEAYDRVLALQQLTFAMPEEIEDPGIARCARVIIDLRRAAD